MSGVNLCENLRKEEELEGELGYVKSRRCVDFVLTKNNLVRKIRLSINVGMLQRNWRERIETRHSEV